MPMYGYKAKDGPDRTVEGERYAETREQVLAWLEAQGWSPVFVREQPVAANRAGQRLRRRRVRPRDLTLFAAQMAGLLRSGVPMLRALSTLSEQAETHGMLALTRALEADIRDGQMLSDALGRRGHLFSPLFVSMVRAGESAGSLDHVLARLASAREQEDELRRKVQTALAYPVLVLMVGVATVITLLGVFLPRVVVLFEGYRVLPLPTRMLINASHFMEEYWMWIGVGLVLAGAVLKRLADLEHGRGFVDGIKLGLPGIGRFVRRVDAARFSRTLGLLIESGVPIERALRLGIDVIGNAVVRSEAARCLEGAVRQGATLSSGLKRMRAFPPMVGNMAAVGEEGGTLDRALADVAAFYEREVEQMSRVAVSLVEPVLILVVGGFVGFIVAAMLLPIFSISQGL